MTTLTDNTERLTALDPKQSFIVQAPAGSGKTELLIQRYLTLLATVSAPEEIIAITFTRKAASEMQHRIMDALNSAKQSTPPESKHQHQTWQLARLALAKNHENDWRLEETPQRLRIQTIDSLCASLTRLMPITAQFGAQPEISDNPNKLYHQTFIKLLESVKSNPTWQDAFDTLSLHLDNNFNRLEALCIDMLAKRDHWLFYIFNDNLADTKHYLENALALINEETFLQLTQLLTEHDQNELLALALFSAAHVDTENPLALFNDHPEWPNTSLDAKAQWNALANLLLTKEGQWRKSANKNIGFPAPSSSTNPDEKNRLSEYKQRYQSLLESFRNHDELLEHWQLIRNLPPPKFSEQQWHTLSAILTLLPVLYAQLKLVFSETGQSDFTEISLAALTALGESDSPSDLALKLDYAIQHLLVDEFQDTSLTQLRLLEKLTAGWQPNDGRTLFVVGDPMQSIYRFRNAEVGLFLRAQSEGIGEIPLTLLKLKTNFRSTHTVVDWVNRYFKKIFPQTEDISQGAVTYHPSDAFNKNKENTDVHCDFDCLNPEDEAEHLTQKIAHTLKTHPQESIAVLVQSRAHLSDLMVKLNAEHIDFTAVEIAKLNHLSHIQDLLALTQALLQPLNRIAWLSILRAPWCGLTLNDLHQLTHQHPKESTWALMNNAELIKNLSQDGQTRLQHVTKILSLAFVDTRRKPIDVWLADIWCALGASDYLNEQSRNDCRTFFNVLHDLEQGGDIINLDDLETRLNTLNATASTSAHAHVHLMTLHKSKGLEFDTVFIPGLDRRLPGLDPQLMAWMERPRRHQGSDLILAPIKSSADEHDLIYDYLSLFEKQRLEHESRRLFYVGVTRAKQRLYLSASQNDKPSKGTFLSYLTHVNPQLICQTAEKENTQDAITPRIIRPIQRLKTSALKPITTPVINNQKENDIQPSDLNWQPAHESITGTLVHKIFELISQQSMQTFQQHTIADYQVQWHQYLALRGLSGELLARALKTVSLCIENTLNDQYGRWILSLHVIQHAELAITVNQKQRAKHLIIDRILFDKDKDEYWIIDYKTSQPYDENIETFIEHEKQRYSEQLSKYKKALEGLVEGTIKTALYFPAIPSFAEITFATVTE